MIMETDTTSHDNTPYTLQAEARRIFETLTQDKRLGVPGEVQALSHLVLFNGEETQPFFPAPFKAAEMHAGVLGCVGLWALKIAQDRYGLEDQRCDIDVEHALLNGLGALFMRQDGDWLSGSPQMSAAVKRWDHGQARELYRQLATNTYRSKDGRWFSLHGSMDPTPILEMLQLPQHDDHNLARSDIIDVYMKAVAKVDSNDLAHWSNHVYRMPGTICYTRREFDMLPHAKAIKDEPMYNVIRKECYEQRPFSWDVITSDPTDRRPLSGIKILDLSRVLAAPTIGRVCAVLGANVIRVSSSTNAELPFTLIDGCIGKTSVDLNLKTSQGRRVLLDLIADADVFIDGYRPGVLEHLGFGRDAVLGLVATRDRGIVYCQENCYGWKGPWSSRAGWAQIADAASGVAMDVGRFNGFDDEAQIFPGPNVDYLTGHAGAAAVLHALYLRSCQGGSYVTQCALLVSDLHMQSYGTYTDEQQEILKARNKDLVGHHRRHDEVISHHQTKYVIRGFVADRRPDCVLKKNYYQTVDGSVWGLGELEVIRSALYFSGKDEKPGMRTDFPVGPHPPGYHLPRWARQENSAFEPIIA